MRMAKASNEEIDRSLTLAGILGDVEKGYYPRDEHGDYPDTDPAHFDEDDREHLREFHRRIMACTDGLFRVVFGFATLMDDNNQLINPDVDYLAPHPRIVQALTPWTAVTDALPDSDTTVMTYAPGSNEPIWPAYHDGEQWVDLNGAPVTDAEITHWMPFPDPPEVAA